MTTALSLPIPTTSSAPPLRAGADADNGSHAGAAGAPGHVRQRDMDEVAKMERASELMWLWPYTHRAHAWCPAAWEAYLLAWREWVELNDPTAVLAKGKCSAPNGD